MKSLKVSSLCVLILCLCGCEEAKQASFTVINSSDESNLYPNNSYIDGLAICMLDEYRSIMKDYQFKTKFEQDFELRLMPPIIDPKQDSRFLIFGSEENCIQAVSKLDVIYRMVDEANYMFSTIINLLDENYPSYTFENYKESLLDREYIKYLISSMSRYLKISHNALNYILSGMLVDDMNLVTAGFNILSQENKLFNKKDYYYLYSLLKHNPKNLERFFWEIYRDSQNFFNKMKTIEKLYREICSSITNKKEGQLFIRNQEHIKNLSKNISSFLRFLHNLGTQEKKFKIFN